MFELPSAREGEGAQVSLADEIERTRAEAEDPPPKRYYSASGDYLRLLDLAATSIVAVLRAAEAVVREHAPFDDECGCDYCCDTASEQGTCSFCALRRALEDCDGA